MKAIIFNKYGPPEIMKLEEIDKPSPKDNEVLIRVHAAAVTSTDPDFRNGGVRFITGMIKPKSNIPGTDFAGQIETVGKDVTLFKKDDRVYGTLLPTTGTTAEYICMAEDRTLVVMPDNISYDKAAAFVDGGITALPFLREKGDIQSGQKVLVYGASGSIGTAAVQIAKSYGTEVTGVCSSSNIDMVKSIGADQVVDYTKEDYTKNGKTYDIIFDTVAKSSFSRCKSSLNKGGIYLTTMPNPISMLQLLWTSKIGSKKVKFAATGLRKPGKKVIDLNFLNDLLENGKINPVIDKIYPMNRIAEAHEYVAKKHKKGNVVIDIDVVPTSI
ncbi:MAG: NAD(P)-dependent alcohol dehydrogenase [Candidatus Kapabacteria bacterium]|jgi:NADPH:quinone reductase-like Zn-dependent oxidoreductase|nr:NAD(P)-dependent alcohol dehydrogenase [Candidatus Kapabacteria bacterium]